MVVKLHFFHIFLNFCIEISGDYKNISFYAIKLLFAVTAQNFVHNMQGEVANSWFCTKGRVHTFVYIHCLSYSIL